MSSDGVFFLGVLLFFFFVWLAGGGPARPISFAGPYITPITNVDQTQAGYGSTKDWLGGIPDAFSSGLSGLGSSFKDTESRLLEAQAELRRLESAARDLEVFGDPSPYKDQVDIVSVSASNTVQDEYVTIQMSANAPEPLTITGWRLKSMASGKSATIPEGTELPRTGVNQTGAIVLRPGDQAIIATSDSPIGVSFRENKCVGYFAQRQSFTPSLWSSCPSPLAEFERYYEGNRLKDDRCYSYVQSLPLCTAVNDPPSDLSFACENLVEDYLDYRGCVDAHRLDAGFTQNRYRVFLERSSKLWKTSREAIRLLDENGKTVDLYTY
ncbi:MAG TPA: hypothetical protein VFY28_02075 [Candidatus Paceibacterota bacterium]|nr:hypothetical protein [Candidatus Paceibacterota bacterium]